MRIKPPVDLSEGDLPSDPLIARAILEREAILKKEADLSERREKVADDGQGCLRDARERLRYCGGGEGHEV